MKVSRGPGEAVTLGWLVEHGVRAFGASSATPRLDAEVLAAFVADVPRSAVLGFPEREVAVDAERRFRDLAEHRAQGVPVAYLTGRKEFFGLELAVSAETLVPRPETEVLVEQALGHLSRGKGARVLDLGTGCGAIALAIKSSREDADVTGADASAAALHVARRNARALRLRVHWRESDWFSALGNEPFDLIVSNPPYVARTHPDLSRELRHEPRLALDGGPDGLDAIRSIVTSAPPHMVPNGRILLEHGHDQGAAVAQLLRLAAYRSVETLVDFSGNQRVTAARAP